MSDDQKIFMPSEPLVPGGERYGVQRPQPARHDDARHAHTSPNAGTHVVHTGGEHASYLQLPVKNA